MPFDGCERGWEPRREPEPWTYVVSPHWGPRGGRGPYRGRWTIDRLIAGEWRPMCSLIARNQGEAHGIAWGLVRRMSRQS